MKPTKKKKNTYIINHRGLINAYLFSDNKTTPLAIIEINGEKISHSNGWRNCFQFPNPAAYNMIKQFDKLKPVMGERLACTIIEYLDKETEDPVALLFPTNEIMYCEDAGSNYLNRLNHATRQDLDKQMRIREKHLQMLKSKNQKQK